MRSLILALTALAASAETTPAHDGHKAVCEVTDWDLRHNPFLSILSVGGRTTCESGKVVLYFYHAHSQKFIYTDTTEIHDHYFFWDKTSVYRQPDVSLEFSIVPN